MLREGTGFGFSSFGSYKPGSVYDGFTLDNDWFLKHCPHDDIATAGDISRRTGVEERSFAGKSENVVSIAEKSGEAFLRVLESQGLAREQCKGVLLGTCAVTGKTLGLRPGDMTDINEEDPEQLVQRAAEKIAAKLGMGDALTEGHNYACSSAAKLTEVGLKEGNNLRDDEFYLMLMAEKLGDNLDLRDRNTGFLFGDHVSVTALKRGETRFNILHAFADTFPADALITMEEQMGFGPDGKRHHNRKCIRMNKGGSVLEEASGKMLDAMAVSLDALGMEPREVGEIIPHQANSRFKKAMGIQWRRRGWEKPEPPIDISMEKAGNNGAASWARRMAERQNDFRTPGFVIMSPFVGAGPYFDSECLSTGNMVIEIGDS
jgi:3-oxoacyl-[acyl-carrier-protein] synthase III